MKRPEKVKVKVRCLAVGEKRYLKNSVLSGAEITPDILRELACGSGTLEVVQAAPVEKPAELKPNKEATPLDNTINISTVNIDSFGESISTGEIYSEKENNYADTEMDSTKEVKESTEGDAEEAGTKEEAVVKKAPTVAKKKTVKASRGNKKK